MADPIKVSVIMPARNARPFIDQAIQSVLSQNYRSFELVIGDDASTDGTRSIIRRYKRHPKVRIYSVRRHVGSPAMRNRLIRMARGKYISLCDADDKMAPGNLKLLSSMLDGDREIGVAHGEVRQMGMKRLLTTWNAKSSNRFHPVNLWGLFFPTPPHPGSMIRKELVVELGGYVEHYPVSHDFDLMMKLAEITKVCYLRGRVCYLWRRHPRSLTLKNDRWRTDTRMIVQHALERFRTRSKSMNRDSFHRDRS